MGMSYVIGYNPSFKEGEQWKKVYVNSTEDIYISSILSHAIKDKYPEIYEKICEESGLEFMKFDELSKMDFMKVILTMRSTFRRKDLTPAQREGMDLWQTLIEPLILVDERYES